MYQELKNKVIIVTGGAGGIGQATVRRFLEERSKVIVVDRNNKALIEFAKTLLEEDFEKRDFWSNFRDLNKLNEVKEMVEEVIKRFDRIDILVNLAGNAFGKDILEIDEEIFEKDLTTNLYPTFWCTREVLPQMINQGYGVIVNISSINGIVGIGEVSYSAAKAGVISLTQTTAVRYGRHGIRCNCLAPGTIRTQSPSWVERLKKDPRVLDKIASKIPRKKVGTPEEVASIILFLASDQSALMNGATIVADGGWTLACGTIKEKEGPWWVD